jgi:spoIIIJ-associated protein
MSDNDSSSGDERRTVEVSAQSVEEAVVRGLVRLGGLSRSEVRIEVLSEGRAGLLGFGAEDAKVRLITLLPGEAPSPVEPKPERASKKDKPETSPSAKAPAPIKPAEKPAPQKSREGGGREASRTTERAVEPTKTPEPQRARSAESRPEPKPRATPTKRSAPAAEKSRPASEDDVTAGREIVATLLGYLGFEESGTSRKDSLLPIEIEGEDSLVLSVSGPGTERLISHGGRPLQALQFVSRLLLSRRQGQWTNLLLDVDGDRARRIKEIYMMAEQSAELVEREGRAVSLPPMTPYERRVVHLALREHDSIASQSIGDGPDRKVTVRRKDQLLPDL